MSIFGDFLLQADAAQGFVHASWYNILFFTPNLGRYEKNGFILALKIQSHEDTKVRISLCLKEIYFFLLTEKKFICPKEGFLL